MEKSFVTERLVLREAVLEDGPRIEEIINDYEIAKMTTNIPYPYPKGGAADWINNMKQARAEGKEFRLSIALNETGEIIGAIGFRIDAQHKKAELGYWLGKAYWEKDIQLKQLKR